jgi:hypothetical protein
MKLVRWSTWSATELQALLAELGFHDAANAVGSSDASAHDLRRMHESGSWVQLGLSRLQVHTLPHAHVQSGCAICANAGKAALRGDQRSDTWSVPMCRRMPLPDALSGHRIREPDTTTAYQRRQYPPRPCLVPYRFCVSCRSSSGALGSSNKCVRPRIRPSRREQGAAKHSSPNCRPVRTHKCTHTTLSGWYFVACSNGVTFRCRCSSRQQC